MFSGYLGMLLRIIPIALIIGTIVYSIVYMVLRKRKVHLSIKRHIFGFGLCLYLVMIIFITIVGVGFHTSDKPMVNLTPFEFVYNAYSLGNSNIMPQFILNIIMFIPLGFMIGITFRSRVNTWLGVGVTLVITTIVIETTQYFIGRSVDIDDVIANTLGGLVGYSIYILSTPVMRRIGNYKNIIPARKIQSYVAGVIVILIAAGIPLGFEIKDRKSEFGVPVNMGFKLPKDVKISAEIDDTKSQKMMYIISRIESRENRMARLCSLYNIDSVPVMSRDKYSYISNEDEISVNVRGDGTWSMNAVGKEEKIKTNKLTDEYCKKRAAEELKKVGIKNEDVQFKKIEVSYDSLGKELNYEVKPKQGEKVIGEIKISIGNKGILREFSYNTKSYKKLRNVEVISKNEIMRRANKLKLSPNDYFQGVVTNVEVNSISDDYIIEDRKGHLHPAYKLKGKATVNGQVKQWEYSLGSVAL
ncbi:MAG: VanZ family protein [Clostridium sp.]